MAEISQGIWKEIIQIIKDKINKMLVGCLKLIVDV